MAALLAVGQPPPPSPLQSPPMAATATATAQAPVARWTITLHDSVVRTATTAGLTNGGNGHVDTKQATKTMTLKVYSGTTDQSLRRAILTHFQQPLANLLQLRDSDGDDVPISASLPTASYTAIVLPPTTSSSASSGSSHKRARLSSSSSSSSLSLHGSPIAFDHNGVIAANTNNNTNNTGRLSISRTRSNSLANGILSGGSDITLRLPSSILEYIFSWCTFPSISSYMVLSYSHLNVARHALERISHVEVNAMSPMIRLLMTIPRRLVSLTINTITDYELDAFKMAVIAMVTTNQSTLRHIHLVPEEIIGSLLFIAIQGCRLLETLILPRVARHDTNYSDVLVPIATTCPRLATFGVESGIATLADIMEFLKSDLQLKEFKFRHSANALLLTAIRKHTTLTSLSFPFPHVDAIPAEDIPTYMESQLTPLFAALPNLSQLLMHAAEYPCPPTLVWTLPSLTNIHWVSCRQLPQLQTPQLKSITISRWDGIANAALDVNLNTLLHAPALTSIMIGLPLLSPMSSIRWSQWPLLTTLRLDEGNEMNQDVIDALSDACPDMEVVSVAVPHQLVKDRGWLVNMCTRWHKLHTLEVRVPILAPSLERKSVVITHSTTNTNTTNNDGNDDNKDGDHHPTTPILHSPSFAPTGSDGSNGTHVHTPQRSPPSSDHTNSSDEKRASPSPFPSPSASPLRNGNSTSIASSPTPRVIHPCLASVTVDRIDPLFFTTYSCPYLTRLAVSDAEDLTMDSLLTFLSHCQRCQSLAILGMAPSMPSKDTTLLKLPSITTFHTQSHTIMPGASVKSIITALRSSLTDITIDFATASLLAVLATEPLLANCGLRQLNISATTMTMRDIDVFIAFIARFKELRCVRVPDHFAIPLADAIAHAPALHQRSIPCKVLDWDVE